MAAQRIEFLTTLLSAFRTGAFPGLLLLSTALLTVNTAGAAVFGREGIESVHRVNGSAGALCIWHRSGARDMPLVHISASPGLFSSLVQIEHDLHAIRSALEESTCRQLTFRTGHLDRDSRLYGDHDFIYLAYRLGIVRELWWVVPAKETLQPEELPSFREQLRGIYRFPRGFIESLTYEDRMIRGSFHGLPVHILALRDLPRVDGPALLHIDTGWFLDLYENPVKESMVDLVGGFFKTLHARNLQGGLAVVSSSAASGATPLRYRYLGAYVRDLLVDPERFGKGPSPAWDLQARIEYLDFLLARDEAAEVSRRLAALEPESPVPWYDLAYIAASRGDVKGARASLREAARRDPAYDFGYIPVSSLLSEGGLQADAVALLEEGYRADSGNLDVARALGRLYMREKRYQEAVDLYADLVERFPGVPYVHADYSAALWMKGERESAARHMDAYRATAHPGLLRGRTLRGWEVMRGTSAHPEGKDADQ